MSMLRRYELQGCAEQYFETLSGGQQARFQILLLELSGATLLLLDEPTDNLDLVSAEALEVGLAQFDGTVVAVTHDRWFLRGFDRFVVFGDDCTVTDHALSPPSGTDISIGSDHRVPSRFSRQSLDRRHGVADPRGVELLDRHLAARAGHRAVGIEDQQERKAGAAVGAERLLLARRPWSATPAQVDDPFVRRIVGRSVRSPPVLIPMMSRSAGTRPPFSTRRTGTSALQCGHQWARNTSIVALVVSPPSVIGFPSKSRPGDHGSGQADGRVGAGSAAIVRRQCVAGDLHGSERLGCSRTSARVRR